MEELRGLHISYPDQLCLAGSETTETFGITAEQARGGRTGSGRCVCVCVYLSVCVAGAARRVAPVLPMRPLPARPPAPAPQLWGLWLVYGVVVVAAVLVALSMFLRRKRAASQAALRVPSGLPGAAPARPAAASRDPEAAVGRQALPATRSERERWLEQEVADIRAALQSTLTRL